MIRKADTKDAAGIAALALMLWPDNNLAQLQAEFEGMLLDDQVLLLICQEQGQSLAFAHCSLRHDYVEGCDSSPVAYLEGIFVLPGHRGRGIGRQLLGACEAWAKAQGCSQFASDCELDNTNSLRFHLHQGFQEANRVICFVKDL